MTLEFDSRNDTAAGFRKSLAIYGTGKFEVGFEKVLGTAFIKPDPALSKLATGKLELEVKEPEKLPPEKEPFTAWGKEVGGLQAGLGFKAGAKRAYTHGETVTLVVRVRNVGQNDIKFKYYPTFLSENSPTVLDETGKRVSLRGNTLRLVQHEIPKEVNLAVGKEIELYERELRLAKGNENAVELKTRDIFPKGKFLIRHEQVIGQSAQASDKLDPDLEKLATGKLELEVKEPEKLPPEKEPFTAWGKEVGGLQAGFCITNATDIQIGGKVMAVVKLRNVSKETISASAVPLWVLMSPPKVVDSQGKPVRTTDGPYPLLDFDPTKLTLKPGEEVDVDKTEVTPHSGSVAAFGSGGSH